MVGQRSWHAGRVASHKARGGVGGAWRVGWFVWVVCTATGSVRVRKLGLTQAGQRGSAVGGGMQAVSSRVLGRVAGVARLPPGVTGYGTGTGMVWLWVLYCNNEESYSTVVHAPIRRAQQDKEGPTWKALHSARPGAAGLQRNHRK